MRTRRVTIVAVLAAVALAGCDGSGEEAAPSPSASSSSPAATTSPSPSPSATPSGSPSPSQTPSGTAKVVQTVCDRLDPGLVRTTFGTPLAQSGPEVPPVEFGIPTYDVCRFTLKTGRNGLALRVGVSVLPATTSTLAASRKADAANPRQPIATAAIGRGGYGTSQYLVFLQGERMIKLTGPIATLAKYVTIGRQVARELAALPPPRKIVTLEQCDRGSWVAEKVMGARAVARRDLDTDAAGPTCGWITATSTLSSSARFDPAAKAQLQAIGRLPTSRPIPFGAEGYVDTRTGRTTIRVGDKKLVELVPYPARAVNPGLMTDFALAMNGLYAR